MMIPWVQDTINLKANTEYVYSVTSPANVVMVRNHDSENHIYLANESVSLEDYDAIAIPKSWGAIGQPSQIRKVHIISSVDISNVKLYLILSESPTVFMGNMLRAVEGSVQISATPGLKAGELNIDALKNLAVKVVNLDEIDISLDAEGLTIDDLNISSSPDLKANELNIDELKNLGVNIENIPEVTITGTPKFDINNPDEIEIECIKKSDLNTDIYNNVGVFVTNLEDFPSGGEGGVLSGAKQPYVQNVNMVSANAQYSTMLPAGVKKFTVGVQSNDADYRLAFEAGKVATGVSPFISCPSGFYYSENDLLLEENLTLYLACEEAGRVIQVIYWV